MWYDEAMIENAFVPAWTYEEGRRVHLSLEERVKRIQRPNERWIPLDQLPEARQAGWVPVEAIWHDEQGSRREPWGL